MLTPAKILEIIKTVKGPDGSPKKLVLRRRQPSNSIENPTHANLVSFTFTRFLQILQKSLCSDDITQFDTTACLHHVYSALEMRADSLQLHTTTDVLTEILETIDPDKANRRFEGFQELPQSYHAVKGRRRTMEDRHISLPHFSTIFSIYPDQTSSKPLLHLFAVFDGHGGTLAAEYAHIEFPRILSQTLRNHIASEPKPSIEACLKAALMLLNEGFLKYCKSSESGSTASVVLFDSTNQILHSAWVGDTEACLLYPSKSKPPTALVIPHKLTDPHEAARIEAAGGKIVHYDTPGTVPRVNGVLAIARAIGDRSERVHGIDCIPDYICQKIETKNTAYLVVACDGLWDVADSADCSEIIKEQLGDSESPQFCFDMCRRLVSHAFQNQSSDNISVLIVDVSPGSMKSPKSNQPHLTTTELDFQADEKQAVAALSRAQSALQKRNLPGKVAPLHLGPAFRDLQVSPTGQDGGDGLNFGIQGNPIRLQEKEVFATAQIAKIVKSHEN